MDYPHINEPQRQADGTYQVQVERAPGDFKSVAYPDKVSAARGVQALRAGAELLVAPPKPPGPGGRKSKLTPEVRKRLVAAARRGLDHDAMADVAGVHRATFYAWMAKGRAAKSGMYRELLDALTCAKSVGEDALVALIEHHAKKDWRAAAFLAECRRPDRYGRKRRVEITGADGGPVAVSSEDALARLDALLERAEEDGDDGV